MFLFPVPVGKVVVSAASCIACELEGVHGVNTRHLVKHLLCGNRPIVRVHVVIPVGVNCHFVTPIVARGVVAVVRSQHVDACFEHLVDEGRLFFGHLSVAIADFVDVSPVKVRRNFLDARICINGNVDGQCGGDSK